MRAIGVAAFRFAALCAGFAALPADFGGMAAAHAAYSDAEIRSVETPDESRIREIREQEITQLRITLGRREAANRKADLYLRLAEIYLEAYRMDYILEGRVHDSKIEKGQPDKFIDHSHSRPHLNSGIKACKEILTFRIPYAKLDQVHYFLGYNYGELGNRAESLKHFEHLTRHYPGSRFAAEAYREMGDDAFQAANYRKAIALYEKALPRASGDALPRIQHKLAWSFYRVRQFDRAVDLMKQAIAATQKSGEKFISLREEALRDMAIFMTETGRVDEALAYFQGVGDRSFYPRALEKLGRQYERNVEPVKATQVYESLLKTHPDSDAAFRVLVKLVDLDLRRGRFKEALARLQNASLPSAKEDETQAAAQNLRAMIRRTATEHHETFRKKSDRAALEVAESYYQGYLRVFLAKDDPRNETPEIQMYLAEVKRELGKSREASALYRKVVDSSDKRYAKEAGALWTASLAEAIKKSHSGEKAGSEPSELEKEFVSAADDLQDSLGDTPEGREAALKAAEVLAGYKSTQKDSIKRIRKLISRAPRTAQAVTAARLWLQLLSERIGTTASAVDADAVDAMKDAMSELKENAALLAADQEQGKGKLKLALSEQETRIKIAAIASDEKEKDYESAAKGYEAFAKEASARDIAEKAFANAMGAYGRSSDREAAEQGIERVAASWVKRFPGSSKAVESLRAAATQALIQGRFESAAKLFERLGMDGDLDSLETAGRIHEGNGEQARAEQLWRAYLERQKTGSARAGVALQLAKARESAKADSDAAKAYKQCIESQSELEAECVARLADLHLRAKDVAQAKALYRKAGALAGKQKPGTSPAGASPFVGYARFKLAVLLEQEARFEPLAFPEARLKAAMNKRLEFLEPLSHAYMAAVEAGGPWAVAALDRLAHWALKLADEIDAIAPPAGADAKSIEQLRANLASISQPLRKKASQAWADSYSKSVAAEALSPAIAEISDRIADIKGQARAQGVRGKFRLAGVPADGGSDGLRSALEKTREKLLKNGQDASAWSDYGNLMWGSGKPLLARLAYDRALTLDRKHAAALNNRAVVALSGAGSEEDWLVASEAAALFESALRQDSFFLAAKMNRAFLLNYYRLFSKARPLWEQVLVKANLPEAQDGLAISLQGLGEVKAAEAAFRKASESGGSSGRFAAAFHDAARAAAAKGLQGCLERLAEIDLSSLGGFEKEAFERMKDRCGSR